MQDCYCFASDLSINDEEKHMVVGLEETRQFFENEGIKVIEIYAVCGMLELFSIPKRFKNLAVGIRNSSGK